MLLIIKGIKKIIFENVLWEDFFLAEANGQTNSFRLLPTTYMLLYSVARQKDAFY